MSVTLINPTTGRPIPLNRPTQIPHRPPIPLNPPATIATPSGLVRSASGPTSPIGSISGTPRGSLSACAGVIKRVVEIGALKDGMGNGNGHASIATADGQPKRSTEQMVFNKYAPAYLPQWFQYIRPATGVMHLPPLPQPVSPFSLTQIFPAPLLQTATPNIDHYPDIYNILNALASSFVIPLTPNPDGYCEHFSKLIAFELQEVLKTAKEQMLFGIKIEPYQPKPGTPQPVDLWKLYIPGIREDHPRLQFDDILHIRGLYRSQQTATQSALEARILGMVKRDGLVFVQCPALKDMRKVIEQGRDGEPEYMVEFGGSTQGLAAMHAGIRRLAVCMLREHATSSRSLVDKWLFPIKADISTRLRVDHFDFKSRLTETRSDEPVHELGKDLNEQQARAIEKVVRFDRAVPFLIVGPPGTGKTKTLVELAMQILIHRPDSHILLTAPSNAAADTLAMRLRHYLPADMMFRLQSPNRTFAEVQSELLQYSFIEVDRFAVPALTDLLKYRVIVVNCLDADLLIESKANNAELLRLERTTLTHLRKWSQAEERTPHWTHLLVDEAGQASEPEIAIPISVMAFPADEGTKYIEPQIIICGDTNQLPAIITSKTARDHALDVSLMERLQERDCYAKANELDDSTSIVKLVNNYRSHPGILLLPSTIFYKDTLEPVAPVRLCQWQALPNPNLPMLIKGIESDEDWVEEGASFYNYGEIAEVLSTVQKLLLSDENYKQSEIGIITPWREQVWRIRLMLREAGLHDINIGNVEIYQGAEYRCIILSCVRSRKRFLLDDFQKGMGMINEPKRFNVAITRAKELMIIIGNMNCHKLDTHWAALLQIALRHNLYVGPELRNFEMSGEWISRLESRIYAQSNGNGKVKGSDSFDNDTMFTAGAVAREALLED